MLKTFESLHHDQTHTVAFAVAPVVSIHNAHHIFLPKMEIQLRFRSDAFSPHPFPFSAAD